MRIQHNIAALNSYRQLGTNNSAISKNLEKLSSGYKINRAGDDAAGLAISEKMRAQITGLETAQKNANDGISLVQTAEGALTEVHSMLNRMVELATQSSNGTYDNDVDRANLQAEIESLTSEIDRIADSTNFNGINLLDGSLSENPATFEIDLSEITFEGTVKAGDTFKLEIGTAAGAVADGTASSIVLESREAYGDETTAEDIAKLFDGQSVTIGGEKYTAKVGDNGILKFTSKTRGELQISQLPTEGTGNINITSSNKDITIDATSAGVSNVVNGGPGSVGSTGSVDDETPEPTPATATTITFDLAGLTLDKALTDETAKITLMSGVELTASKTTTDGTTSENLAAAFEGSKVTIDDVEYTASVEGSKITLTAATTGAPETTTQLDQIKSGTISASVSGGSGGANTSGSITNNKVTVTDGTDGTEEIVAVASVDPKAGTDGTKAAFEIDLKGLSVSGGTITDGDAIELDINGSKVTIAIDSTNATSATDDAGIAGLFAGKTIDIGDTTYDIGVTGTKLTFTAQGEGEQTTGNIPVDQGSFTITYTDNNTTGASIGNPTSDKITVTDGGTDAQPPTDTGNDDGTGTTTNKSLTLQIGDTADSFNKITVSIGSMSAETLNIADIDISTPKGAEQAIQNIKQAINTVSSQRGELGAIQNRLEHTINNLGVTTENITSAESRIRDTDMAEEMMAYTKNNILVQASQAMLAQANTLPQGVLQLLQ